MKPSVRFPPLAILLIPLALFPMVRLPSSSPGLLLSQPNPLDPPGASAAADAPTLAGPPDRSEAAELLSARPLFEASRLQPKPLDAAPDPGPASELEVIQPPGPNDAGGAGLPPPNVLLRGTLVVEGTHQALLETAEDGQQKWYAEGDAIDGWTIAAIGESDVRFVAGDQVMAVQLYPR